MLIPGKLYKIINTFKRVLRDDGKNDAVIGMYISPAIRKKEILLPMPYETFLVEDKIVKVDNIFNDFEEINVKTR